MSNILIVIAGVTGSGKSKLAIEIAKRYNAVIINADSRQVYRELNIATDKPIADKILKTHIIVDSVKHYLYGYKSIYDNYSLYNYQQDVIKIIHQTRSNIPILLVGGTGLYINSIIYQYKLHHIDQRFENRKRLSSLSLESLQKMIPNNILKQLNNSDRNNPRRLIRIIERGNINRDRTPIRHLFLLKNVTNQHKHYIYLKKRINDMFDRGLEKEITDLYNTDNSIFNLPALNTIGYAEFADYFLNEKPLEEVKIDILHNTLRYIKKQRTWFKKNEQTIPITNNKDVYPIIDKFITESASLMSNN